MLSRLLFALNHNELIELLTSEGCRGIFASEFLPNVIILLYAENHVLCSDMVGGLQKQLEV